MLRAGRWAKNVTSLLASLGIFDSGLALAITPANAAIVIRVSQTVAPKVLLGSSSFLLIALDWCLWTDHVFADRSGCGMRENRSRTESRPA